MTNCLRSGCEETLDSGNTRSLRSPRRSSTPLLEFVTFFLDIHLFVKQCNLFTSDTTTCHLLRSPCCVTGKKCPLITLGPSSKSPRVSRNHFFSHGLFTFELNELSKGRTTYHNLRWPSKLESTLSRNNLGGPSRFFLQNVLFRLRKFVIINACAIMPKIIMYWNLSTLLDRSLKCQ